jgi:hypothetical protein
LSLSTRESDKDSSKWDRIRQLSQTHHKVPMWTRAS